MTIRHVCRLTVWDRFPEVSHGMCTSPSHKSEENDTLSSFFLPFYFSFFFGIKLDMDCTLLVEFRCLLSPILY